MQPLGTVPSLDSEAKEVSLDYKKRVTICGFWGEVFQEGGAKHIRRGKTKQDESEKVQLCNLKYTVSGERKG